MKKTLEVVVENKIYLVVFTTKLTPTEEKCEFCENLLYQTSLERIIDAQTKNPKIPKIPAALREIVSQQISKIECRLPSCVVKNATEKKAIIKMQKFLKLFQPVGLETEKPAPNLN
jgi:hypothetical protein